MGRAKAFFMAAFAGLVLLSTAGLMADLDQKQKIAAQENPKDGASMHLLPGGEVVMGSAESEIDEQFRRQGYQKDWKKYALDEIPRHRQPVKSFFIYKYEVSNAQYQKFVAATEHAAPPYWKGKSHPPGKGQHPVVEVSWEDAQAYCRWAGTRLPTEAEWEYAARGPAPAGDKAGPIFPWGNDWDRSLANSASYHAGKDIVNDQLYRTWSQKNDPASLPLTTAVGSFPKGASPFGVHDLAGNAWEWCADRYAPYKGNTASDPGADKKAHVVRGGSWANVPFHLRCADRNAFAPGARNLYIGFRCAKDLE